jgi:predicted DCC family thiol-disulfide oxidoreductase YuxK
MKNNLTRRQFLATAGNRSRCFNSSANCPLSHRGEEKKTSQYYPDNVR